MTKQLERFLATDGMVVADEKTFRDRFRLLMAHGGWSVSDLAKVARVSRTTITAWRDGWYLPEPGAHWQRVCIALGYTPLWVGWGISDSEVEAYAGSQGEDREGGASGGGLALVLRHDRS